MTIKTGPSYWSASIVYPYKERAAITKEMDHAIRKLLGEGDLWGKGLRRRYMSDYRFKTQQAAEKFWTPIINKLPKEQRRFVQINNGFDLFF